jgi:hypothetical protein
MLAFPLKYARMITTPATPRVSPTRPLTGAHDRLFYGALAIAMAITVFAGFARTYYGPLALGGPRATLSGGPWTPVVQMHGALFTAWVLLFVVQTALVAGRRVAIHRRLGIAGAILAAAMVVTGSLTAIANAARGGSPVGVDPLVFLAVPLFDMVMFSGFIIAALTLRRNKEAHKRLMLLAYASIIAAATARLPGVIAFGPPAFFGLALVFVVVGVIYDRTSRGRVHPVYKWGGTILLLSVPLRLAISSTPLWRSFAEWLVS